MVELKNTPGFTAISPSIIQQDPVQEETKEDIKLPDEAPLPESAPVPVVNPEQAMPKETASPGPVDQEVRPAEVLKGADVASNLGGPQPADFNPFASLMDSFSSLLGNLAASRENEQAAKAGADVGDMAGQPQIQAQPTRFQQEFENYPSTLNRIIDDRREAIEDKRSFVRQTTSTSTPKQNQEEKPISSIKGSGTTYDLTSAEQYIRQAARARGIDEEIAVRVAKSEGLMKMGGKVVWQSTYRKGGEREPSYGPFQLLVGKGSKNFPRGLGDKFIEKYGEAPSGSNIQKQIDFALDFAKKNGWSSWYGAKRVGISRWAGIQS